MRRAFLTVIVAGFLILPSGASAIPVGISEQHEEFMSAPLFKETNMTHARRIVGWDAIYSHWERPQVDEWMFAARIHKMDVMVSFGHSRSHDKRPPSAKRYSQAIKRFISRYPWIKTYSTWNEPNLGKTRKRPKLVARYWRSLNKHCPDCKLIGAEVVDSGNMSSWLKRFMKSAKIKPEIWGLHNYNDTNHFKTVNTEKMLSMVEGKVWLTETGGIVGKKAGRPQRFPGGEQHQTSATRFLLDKLAPLSERIDRVYLYHWNQETKPGTWDSGLVRKDGTPRKAYFAVKKRLNEDGRLAIVDEEKKEEEKKPSETPSNPVADDPPVGDGNIAPPTTQE